MGNESSTGKRSKEAEKYGKVYLQLNNDTFNPGDTVKGTIYINLTSVYPGDKLCLKVKGKEFTKWIDKEARQRDGPDGQPETYYVDVPREGELDHIKQVVDVYDWAYGAALPPGQFSFPIQFTIPKGIPSSFFMRRGNVVGEIRYYVEAYLKPDFDKFPKIKFKRDIIIKETLNQTVQTKEVSMNKEITTCCCFGQGNVSMKTYFEKNAYHPGETARIVTEVDNSQCKLDVTSVNFSLVQTVTLRAQNHQRAFNFTIRSAGLGSIPAGQSFVGQNRKEAQLELPPPIEGNARAFKGDKIVDEYNVDPSMAMSPSTNGNLVKSNFSLSVFCGMDACCMCDGIPGTSLPITVYSLAQQKIADPTPPAGWNPTAMPQANLSITINVGGQTIQINHGGDPNQGGMVNNQMPPQQNMNQPPFSQPQQNMNQPQQNMNQPPMNQSTPYNNQPPQNNYNQPPQNNQPQYNNQQPQYNNQPPQNNQPQYNNQPPQNNQPNYNNQPQNMNQSYNNQQPQNYNNQPQNNQPNYNNQPPQNNQPNYNNQQQNMNQSHNNQQPQNNYNNQGNPGGYDNHNQGNQSQHNNYNNQPPQNYNNNQGQQNNYNNQPPQNYNNQPQNNYNNQPPQNYNNQPGYNNQPNYNQPQNVNPQQVNVGGPRY